MTQFLARNVAKVENGPNFSNIVSNFACNVAPCVCAFSYKLISAILQLNLQSWLLCLSDSVCLSTDYSPRLYQTSISPLSVRTSMIVCPRKSSGSLINLCLTLDLISSSSSLKNHKQDVQMKECQDSG